MVFSINSPVGVAIFATAFSLGIYYLNILFKERRRGKSLFEGIIPMHKPHWLYGHMDRLQANEESMVQSYADTKFAPKVSQLWVGPFVWYMSLNHPEVVKTILATEEPKSKLAYGFLRPWIGDGLLVSSGKKWHRNRHILTKAFHFDILKGYYKVFNECANTLLGKWEKRLENETIEMFRDVSLLTLDTMLQCTMSSKSNCQMDGNEKEYVNAVNDMTKIAMKRAMNPLIFLDFIFYLTPGGRRFKAACEYVHQYDEKIIKHRRSVINSMMEKKSNNNERKTEEEDLLDYQEESGKNLDFLDILILTTDEDGKGLSDKEIRDEVDTFLFEGHDTTASGISWAFYCLASNPDLQEKCREEVKQVLGEKENVEWKDLSKLTYLTMFIKEVLRYYSPVFMIARSLTKPIHLEKGFEKDGDDESKNSSRTVEDPCDLIVPITLLHHHLSLWNKPEIFDPDRFLPENVKNRPPHAYIPFSAGPRNCIGKNFAMGEMKIVLAKSLQCFRFYIDEDCPPPIRLPMVILRTENGIHLKMEKLQHRI